MFCKLNKINGRAGHTRSQLINKTLMSAKNDIKITQNISAFHHFLLGKLKNKKKASKSVASWINIFF